MNKKQITKRYNQLLKDVESKEYYTETDLTNRVNCYVCDNCKTITKTIDIDSGVTPFIHSCKNCGGMAKSTFYRDIEPRLKPTEEWYRPTLEQILKFNKKGNIAMVDHILKGGLAVRKIKVKA